MQKKLTISMDAAVYNGLIAVIGRRNISRFLTELARPHVTDSGLEEGYHAKALDLDSEYEALEWSEAIIGDVTDERA